jgi:hypothetical protein
MFKVRAKYTSQGITKGNVYTVVDIKYILDTPYFLIYDQLGRWYQYSSEAFAIAD